MTSKISIKQEFKGSIEKTWSKLIDSDLYPSRAKSCEAIEWLTSEKFGVGAKWKQTRWVYGKSHTQTIEAVEWRGPNSFAMTATEARATYLTRYSLGESKGGETTEVSASFEVQPNNLFIKVFVKLIGKKFLGSTRETLRNDLSCLANAEEKA